MKHSALVLRNLKQAKQISEFFLKWLSMLINFLFEIFERAVEEKNTTMTTCKEQCIKSRCIVQEKEKNRQNDSFDLCDDRKKTGFGKGLKVDEKQMEEFRRVAVCMQKCLKNNNSERCNDC